MVTGKAVLKNEYTDQCNGSAGKELDTQKPDGQNLMHTSYRNDGQNTLHEVLP